MTGYDENNVTCDLKKYKDSHLDFENDGANCFSVSTENIENLHVGLFPNPALDKLTISGIEDQTLSGVIYNSFGQNVLTFDDREVAISTLAIGIYFMRIEDEYHDFYVGKFVKEEGLR